MALEQLEIGLWVIEVDRDATQGLYAEVTSGAEECPCGHCQHWHGNRESIYPEAVRQLLNNHGIDYRREAEVYELDPTVDSHSCGGWFHFVGRVISGPATEWYTTDAGSAGRLPDPTPVTDDFGVFFSGGLGPMKSTVAAAHDRGVRIAQLGFMTTRHQIESEFE